MTQRRKWVWTCMINETIDYFMTKTRPLELLRREELPRPEVDQGAHTA